MTTKITKSVCEQIRRDAVAVLEAVAAKYGVSITHGNGTFSDVEYSTKFTFRVTDPTSLEERDRLEFRSLCGFFDLEPTDYGAVISISGTAFRLVGFAPKRSKYPIRMTRVSDGEVILYTDVVLDRVRAARKVA